MSYFPLKEADFVEWSGNLIAVSKENITLGALPAEQVTGLETLHNESKALHEKCATASYTKLDMQSAGNDLDEDQRGKRLWFAVRWENGTVQKGKWSDIFSAVIP